MTRRPRASALPALSPSLAARNPSLAPSPRPARPTPRTAPPGASAGVVVVELPGLRLASEANTRAGAHWARTKRTEAARAAVARAMPTALPPLPLRVCVTRRAPGTLDDDNAASAAKATRDAVAAALGVDDADPRVTWRVAQERTPRGVYGVRVTLAPLPALRSTVDAGEAADVVTLRVTREALGRWADAALAGDGATLDAGGVLVVAEMTEARR